MSETLTHALHDKRFPNETSAYREARNDLLQAEIDLRRQVEAVAALRRALPPGGMVSEDYLFEEGDPPSQVRLSELFAGHETLIAYSFMYGPSMSEPCPSCSSMLDSLDRQARFLRERVGLAVVARSPIARILAFAGARGWRDLRLVSAAGNTYAQDYFAETPDGAQRPIMNVFSRRDGAIRHVWASELAFAPPETGQDPRHIDLLWPLWDVLDLTPEGRGDYRRSLDPS
jgi:predicted dithiol-disulfide oxidoreductase (DUF899 family)